MIHIRPAQSPEYYLTADCPLEDGKIEARYMGKAKKPLGLGEFKPLEFLRLAKGLNPETGSQLTAQLKASRKEADDLTITVPKELGIIIEVGQDERAKAAFWKTAEYAFKQFEKKAKVRVRKGGVDEDRHTGIGLGIGFYHGTGRPVSEPGSRNHLYPDANPHIHIYVPNLTLDKLDARKPWKALKRHHFDIPEIQRKSHHFLAKELRKIGHKAKVEEKWEERTRYVKTLGVRHKVKQRVCVSTKLVVSGISEEMVALHSRRQGEVFAEIAKRPGLQQEGNATFNKKRDQMKAQMSQATRQSKDAMPPISKIELHRNWVSRFTKAQFDRLTDIVQHARRRGDKPRWRLDAKKHVEKLRRFAMVRDTEAQGPQRSLKRGYGR